MAHDLARWTAWLGLGAGIVTVKTFRRRVFGLVARLTRGNLAHGKGWSGRLRPAATSKDCQDL